ncbi:coatomer subunit beta'-like isoform X5 [Dreissena polymorpha]|uniref:coatomer subunit beta'-like isoform X5 n=1 Tax=Dreissena polymorpha TaxID=45954 RepID=UPI002263D779|nr:coatomer subunit beta'-like isoform X5 [Dreissena polymorpha]
MGEQEVKDGERMSVTVKDMGACEIYPQNIQHNPNGRFVCVCGDGEYIIYTAMALRNKSFGSAQEFVWSNDSSVYAIREVNSMVKIFKNFKELKTFKPDFGCEGIHGGNMLGVRSVSGLAFYDWETTDLVRRIEISPKNIYWSENGELVCISTEESFFILKYRQEAVDQAKNDKELVTEDGIEEAFDVVGEIEEVVETGVWVGDCFIYTDSVNRLNYYVGGEIVTIAHLDRVMYILGYIPKDNRLYLGDKELNVISFSLLLSVLEYQTAVIRQDFETADKVLPTVPREHRTRVAHFLEKQGFKSQALAVTCDPEHKFELSVQLGDLKIAYQIAKELEGEHKWKQLAEMAIQKCEFGLALECLHQAQDFGGLLLLASSAGNAEMLAKLGDSAEKAGHNNVAFLSHFVLGRLENALEVLVNTGRLPEAAFFARTYLPSQVSRVVKLWRESLGNMKAASSLADPREYENLFPGFNDTVKCEQYLKPQRMRRYPARTYPQAPANVERHPLEEMAAAEEKGAFSYQPPRTDGDDEEEEQFQEATESQPARTQDPDIDWNSKPSEEDITSGQKSSEPVPELNIEAEAQSSQPAVQQPKLGAKEMADLEKELELDLENLDVNTDGVDTGDTQDIDLDENLLGDRLVNCACRRK